jgi:hypothetical protein
MIILKHMRVLLKTESASTARQIERLESRSAHTPKEKENQILKLKNQEAIQGSNKETTRF